MDVIEGQYNCMAKELHAFTVNNNSRRHERETFIKAAASTHSYGLLRHVQKYDVAFIPLVSDKIKLQY
jgi:hypothetical protein